VVATAAGILLLLVIIIIIVVVTTPPCKTFMLRNTYRHDASSGDKAIRR